MSMDPTRRGLLRAATLAGIGAMVLPGTTLLPIVQASATQRSPANTPVIVKGWLLKTSDR
ncbi:hypothetical protein [Vreelandella sp. V005]|uniref:hypothetical protein n=1 Tax=Vreelandella sp. V005 TaxID=3459608 RepID=UPI004044CCD8